MLCVIPSIGEQNMSQLESKIWCSLFYRSESGRTDLRLLLCLCFSAQINVNTDVRLVRVNERLIGHGLLLGVADWIERCTGKMQVRFRNKRKPEK